MLNASGKAEIKYKNGQIVSIAYHPDDRDAALTALREFAPKGARIIVIYHGIPGFRDLYVIHQRDAESAPELHNISKLAGSLLGLTIYLGNIFDRQKAGLAIPSAYEVARALGRMAYDDPDAFSYQEVD